MSSGFIVELKWVFERHSRRAEIDKIPGGHGQFVSECRGGDKTILDWHGLAFLFQTRKQLRPSVGGGDVEIEDTKAWNSSAEPLFQAGAPAAGWENENAIFQLAQDDWAHGEIALVAPQPCQRIQIRRRLGGLAQDIRIDKIFQSESVDSDGTG